MICLKPCAGMCTLWACHSDRSYLRRQVFAVGVSNYGVADCELLAQDTHKFESRYLDSLIGCLICPFSQCRYDKDFQHSSAVSNAPSSVWEVAMQTCQP